MNFRALWWLVVISVMFTGCAEKAPPVKLTVLHWNDLHAQNIPRIKVQENGDTLVIGGMANLAGYIDHYRQKYESALVLNAGDEFQGTPISEITRGMSQVELLNITKPDAYTVGNHEFDYGVENLISTFNQAEFPVLLGNVVRSDDGELLFPADTVITVDGIEIGIIGVVTDELVEVSSKDATEGVRVLSSTDAVRRSLKRLSPITDIQIALTHLGVEWDSVLAEEIGPDLELIVGGHSHTLLRQPSLVNGVYILQAGAKGGYLGVAELLVDTTLNKLIGIEARVERIIEGTLPPDERVAEVVERQEQQLSREFEKQVAILAVPWQRNYNGESNLGNFVADAIRNNLDTDIAFINSGGLRKNLDAGPITVRDIYEVCPFNNRLVRFEFTGADLVDYVSRIARREARLMQVSGLGFHLKGSEVVTITVNDHPVQQEKIYTVATVNYVTDHMNKYFGIETADKFEIELLDLKVRDVLLAAVKEAGTVNTGIEERIRLE